MSDEIFGEQADPPPPPAPKPQAENSNPDRDLLNRAQRELEATQNLAVHLKDQVTEFETSKSAVEKKLSAYETVALSLQEQIDEVIRESEETARLVRKAVSTVNQIQKEAYEIIKSQEARLESAIRIGDVVVDSAITLRRIAASLYQRQLRIAEFAQGTWRHSVTKQAALEIHSQNSDPKTSGNRAGWL